MKNPRGAIDPELRRMSTVISAVLPHERTPEDLRRPRNVVQRVATRFVVSRGGSTLRTEVECVERDDGSVLRLVVTRPARRREQRVPGLLWLHGGGYVTGSPDWSTGFIQPFVEGSGCVVVAPDYRLGPEAPYPAALDDSYLALRWLRDNAERLGVRDDQLAIGGESAGGGLTAATSLYARDRGEIAVAFQLPIYPMIDDRTVKTTADEPPVWDSVTNRSAWSVYLGDLHGTGDVPPYAAPARATDFAGLPPTLTYVGDVEVFHDETVAYVEALRSAGVEVEFRVFPGAFHGFDGIVPRAGISREAKAFREQWFGYAVRSYVATQPPRR